MQNYSYTCVTAIKLNNWNALTSETEVKNRLKHAKFTNNGDPRNASWEHQCGYSDYDIMLILPGDSYNGMTRGEGTV